MSRLFFLCCSAVAALVLAGPGCKSSAGGGGIQATAAGLPEITLRAKTDGEIKQVAAAGKRPPAAPTRWLWRLVGVVLGGLGALGLIFCLPVFSPRFAGMHGPLIALIALASVILTTSTWVGAAPVLRRVPLQLALMTLVWLVLFGAGNLSLPRWSFVALAAASAIGCAVVGAYYFALVMFICWLVLFAGTVAGWIAARQGTRRDGDITMAIFVGYTVGLWIPGIL